MISRKLILSSPKNCLKVNNKVPLRLVSYDGFFTRSWQKLTGKSQKQEALEAQEGKEEIEPQYIQDDDVTREWEIEEKLEKLEKDRLKSRLFYSDRAILHNQMPQAGIAWEKNDEHANKEFKSMMLARFGKETGINPSVAWPSKEEIEEQKEYEKVLYDGLSLQEMIKKVEDQIKLEEEKVKETEKDMKEKLQKHEDELKKWQKRVESRNVSAERERQKRATIMAEVSCEFSHVLIYLCISAVILMGNRIFVSRPK